MRSLTISFSFVAVIVAGGLFLYDPDSKATNEILVERTPQVVLSKPVWTLAEKIREAGDILNKIDLKVGTVEITYLETIISHFPTLSKSTVKRREQEKEIALALLNTKTGDITTVIVIKKGGELLVPKGYNIGIVERANGIRWNRWNTQYLVLDGFIVIKNSYPEPTGTTEKKIVYDSRGRKRTVYQPRVENFIYTPYSETLHTTEMVQVGEAYTKEVVRRAFEELKNSNVPSLAVPGTNVADLAVFKPEFFEALPVIEQTDMTEFFLNPKQTVERVHVIIGSNQKTAFERTGSFAGALGWVQYTKSTYNNIRRLYPQAKLIADFKIGVPDHLNSMKAAILLYDYHLQQLMRRSGQKILEDPRLEEYLAAAYNGGTSRISNSLSASISRKLNDWTGELRQETKGYIVKLRAIRSGNLNTDD